MHAMSLDDLEIHYDAELEVWFLRDNAMTELELDQLCAVLDFVKRSGLHAPLIFERTAQSSISFAALRVLELRCEELFSAIACVGEHVATRRTLETIFQIFITTIPARVFSSHRDALAWMAWRSQRHEARA